MKHSQATLYTQKNFKWVDHPITVLGVDITHDKAELLKLNYDCVFTSIEKTAKLWTNRNLSLAGKIITANSLMSSLFVFKLSCLDSPSDTQYEKYKEVIRDYIWDGKTPKIAYSTLISPRNQGGLKLVDLQKKDSALKIQWIKRLSKNENLAALAYYFLPKAGELIWECNLHSKDIKHVMLNRGFWYNVLCSWSNHNFSKKTEKNEIMNSIIWYNSEITVMGKPIVSKKCLDNNVLYVKDFVKNGRDFMTYDEFNAKHGRFLNFIEHMGIIKAIPSHMKDIINTTTQENDTPTSNYRYMFDKCLSSKYYYNESIKNDMVLSKVTSRWENTFNLPFEEKNISKLFMEINVITLSTKLRSFLYSLLHQATMTNVQLFKWKIKDTDKCTFCNVQTETLLHLFWECQTARHLWNLLLQWYREKTGQTVHLDSKKVLFCKPNSSKY